MNDADRLQQVESLFHDALARPSDERAAFLAAACGDDAALLSHVGALLAAHERSGDFIDQPAAVLVGERLTPDANVSPVGRQLGVYQVLALLGRGGMGEVYRARDGRLSREVAIKVLPAEFAHDAGRLRRFELEARAAGMLNHPNIVTIFDFGIHDDAPYIVTELLEGETLRERLKRGALPLTLALNYALQIARGLQAAHEKGIVHRDLKPENLFITRDDRVKILDFGLAKLHQPKWRDAGAATRPSLPQTTPGMVLGTVGYMSPEQVREREADHRADIFVFGVVLYEMLTGKQAFHGDSAAEVMSSILKEDPPELAITLPQKHQELAPIVRRCLHKNPEERFQSVDDLVSALEPVATLWKGESAASSRRLPAAQGITLLRWQLRAAMAGLLLITATAVLLVWWLSRRPAPPRSGPILTQLTSYSGLTTNPVLSPDGKLVAYASDRSGEDNLDIWVQQINGGEAIRLTRDSADDREPAFSPDGSKLAFRSERAGGGIYVISTLGGTERLIVEQGRRPRFSPDGEHIAYWTGAVGDFAPGVCKTYVVPAVGGMTRQLQPTFATAAYPVWSPDGRHILFIGAPELTASPREHVDWWVTPAAGGAAVKTGVDPALRRQGLSHIDSPDQWLPEGHRVLFSARLGDTFNIWQVALSTATWQVAGVAERLTFGAGQEFQPSWTAGSQIVFVSQKENIEMWELPVAANHGKATGRPQPLTQNALREIFPSLSRDGRWLAFVTDNSGQRNIWVKDLRSGKETTVTDSPAREEWPLVADDGARVAYGINEQGQHRIYAVPLGGGAARVICDDCDRISDWSADLRWLLFRQGLPRRVSRLDLTTGHKADLLRHAEYNLYQPHFSTDGRWVVFLAQLSPERRRLYIAPFLPERIQEETNWIAVTDGGYSDDKPRFAPNGNMIYFVSNRDGFLCVWAQRLNAATKRPAGAPFPVYHFHSARLSPLNMRIGQLELSVAADRLVFNMSELTGEVWLARLNEQ